MADEILNWGLEVEEQEERESKCLTMAKTFPGSNARVIIVVMPTEAANSAAISLVTIPSMPTLLPGEKTIGY